MQTLRDMAGDPTQFEIGPLGMTRALKGVKIFHGYKLPYTARQEVIPLREAFTKAEELLLQKYGKGWESKVFYGPSATAGENEFTSLARSIQAQSLKDARRKAIFTKFEKTKAGKGAGGNLWDEGIYFAGHPKISHVYAGYDAELGVVRSHNLPPQAKILDVDKVLSHDELDKLAIAKRGRAPAEASEKYKASIEEYTKRELRESYPNGASLRDLRYDISLSGPKSIATDLGYDGVAFPAGELGGLPPGVPEGTKNYVVYNYDIINNPRTLSPKPKPQPEKALRRFPSPRDKHLIQKREATSKAMSEARKPTREEVEYMVKKKGVFSY